MNETQEKELVQRVRGYGYIDLAFVIRSKVKPAIGELDGAIRMLPRLGRDGESECSFAAQLYAQKESKAAKVAEQLIAMRHRLDTITDEILRCQKNLRVLGEGSAKIHGEATGRQLSYTFAELQRQLKDAEDNHKQAKDSIEEMERLLMYSARITHPDVPSVGVPACSPSDRKTAEKQKPHVVATATPASVKPAGWPAPIPAGPPIGRSLPSPVTPVDANSVPWPAPLPPGPSLRGELPLPIPLPHPVGGTDIMLTPPKNIIQM